MSVANTINISKVCIPLAIRDIAKQKEQDTDYPRKLYIAYQALNDLNTDNPSSADVTLLNDYTFALCGGYYFEAENLLSLGQSGIIVNPSTGVGTLNTIYVQFVVGDVGALLTNGATSFTINIGSGSVFQNGVFQVVADQVVLPRNNVNYFSYIVNYAAGVITVTLNQAAVTGQIYIITGTYLAV
jgi:hypothetical protein